MKCVLSVKESNSNVPGLTLPQILYNAHPLFMLATIFCCLLSKKQPQEGFFVKGVTHPYQKIILPKKAQQN